MVAKTLPFRVGSSVQTRRPVRPKAMAKAGSGEHEQEGQQREND